MATMNISVPDPMKDWVQSQVNTGAYANTSDYVRDEFNPPVKIHHHQKHLIIYVIETDGLLIVRVSHERMDIQQHME